MIDKTFIDSNVLIYAHDLDAGRKRDVANAALRGLWNDRSGVLSLQVLQEFYVNVTRKIPKPLERPMARRVVDTYAAWCIETTPSDISVAFQIEDESRIGFWDALIVSSAVKSGAGRILSEDLRSGQRIARILIENPFGPKL